ncbi:MAG: PilZ domain-containing protein [Fimbriimonadaceae bacterium]|nr:PilZ domain-containing protein [Fimbriimonadaceae bacterium]QYK55597.1 MAG: PilZ domain-containing protein [Fimbriimonadaceae bacterium]
MRFSDGGQFIMEERTDIVRVIRGIVESGLPVLLSGHHFGREILGRLTHIEGAHHRFRPDMNEELPTVPLLTSATLTVNLNAGQVQWNAPVLSSHNGASLSLGIPERIVTGRCRASYRVSPTGPSACLATVEQGVKGAEGHVLDVSFEGVGIRLHGAVATDFDQGQPLKVVVRFQDCEADMLCGIRWSAGSTLGLQLVDSEGAPVQLFPEPWLDIVRRVAYSAVMSQLDRTG